MAGEITQRSTQWRTMSVATGVAGLAGMVLVFTSQALQQVGGGEPPFDASADEILRFLQARHDTLYATGSFLGVLAVLALAWFLAGVSVVLREVDRRPAWRSAAALTSGIAFVVPDRCHQHPIGPRPAGYRLWSSGRIQLNVRCTAAFQFVYSVSRRAGSMCGSHCPARCQLLRSPSRSGQ